MYHSENKAFEVIKEENDYNSKRSIPNDENSPPGLQNIEKSVNLMFFSFQDSLKKIHQILDE